MTGSSRSVLGAGAWAVMGQRGLIHVAAMVGGLPRGGGLCGAVGTAFVVSTPPPVVRVCKRCAELAHHFGISDQRLIELGRY